MSRIARKAHGRNVRDSNLTIAFVLDLVLIPFRPLLTEILHGESMLTSSTTGMAQQLREVEQVVGIGAWWVLLGVLSSVGLGLFPNHSCCPRWDYVCSQITFAVFSSGIRFVPKSLVLSAVGLCMFPNISSRCGIMFALKISHTTIDLLCVSLHLLLLLTSSSTD